MIIGEIATQVINILVSSPLYLIIIYVVVFLIIILKMFLSHAW